MGTTPVNDKRLAFADAIRGLAATWVVLFHLWAGGHIAGIAGALPTAVENLLFRWGHLGVAMFFVLSGFVMALNVQAARVDSAFAGRFMARRLVRLTPPYYVVIAVSVAYGLLKARFTGEAAEVPSLGSWLAHAVYLQDLLGYPQVNGVLWTLCIEVQFYLCFALLLWALDDGAQRASGTRRAALLAATGTLGLAWPLGLVAFGKAGSFLPYWYSFVAGALVCWAWRERGVARTLAWGYAWGLGAVAALTQDGFAATSFVTCAALLIACEAGGMGRWLDLRPLQFLGLISYSLYLLHNHTLGAVFFAARGLGGGGLVMQTLGAAVALAVTALVAYLAYRYIEKPCIAWSRRISVSGAHRPAAG